MKLKRVRGVDVRAAMPVKVRRTATVPERIAEMTPKVKDLSAGKSASYFARMKLGK